MKVLGRLSLLFLILSGSACESPQVGNPMVPLIDLGQNSYKGFSGGLYPNGQNEPEGAHLAAGLKHANAVRPLAPDGGPDPAGRIVFLSIGMSNTTQEFCSPDPRPVPSCNNLQDPPCNDQLQDPACSSLAGLSCGSFIDSNCAQVLDPTCGQWMEPAFCLQGNPKQACSRWSFMGQAALDPNVNHSSLVIVDGAAGGRAASSWVSAASPEYIRIRNLLASLGLTRNQVQIVWLKVANALQELRTPSLPAADADAYVLQAELGGILRTLKAEYPNLQMVFLSSRIYGGYMDPEGINPEPYAYESGFSVKWVIQAQIDQMQNDGQIVDARAGDLDYEGGIAPWVGWGPYLWANGAIPRSDGLVWLSSDLEADQTHPVPPHRTPYCRLEAGSSVSADGRGEEKAARLLSNFFINSPFTRCWFLSAGSCP